MKKILILAYDFPPYVSVGGLRPSYWYENFKEMGLFPIVITRNWNPIHGNDLDYIQPSKTKDVEIEETEKGILIKTPYKATLSNRLNLKGKKDLLSNVLKKISAGYNEIGQWFLPIGTKYELYKAAKKFLKDNKVDVIIATGDPFVLFKYASKLSKKFNIPWVADYRDPWSNVSFNNNPKKKIISQILEKKYLRNVKLICTVSEYYMFIIKKLIKNKPFLVIPNGYDENILINNIKVNQNNDLLTISLTGTIYKFHPYRLFFSVLLDYLKMNPDRKIRVNFYGISDKKDVSDIIKELDILKNEIKIFPKIPNYQFIKEISKSNVLLLFNHYSIMGAKIYDYLALNRKIILCFENDKEANLLKKKYFKTQTIKGLSENSQADLIRKTNSGIVVKDKEHLYKVLDDLFSEFEEKHYIENHTIGVENYSRKIQTEKLVEALKNIN
ncbi:MAG: glycosyltransferase family 4 protein [Bacteroidales bacterium]|nr:glycosyltransferase family 4 protein [Bacteroidales bacterium]